MRRLTASKTRPLFAAAAALGLSTTSALAGGFEVREQSTFFQGMSFAGAAAQGDSLSSMFWNPATAAMAGPGVTTNSNFALILPKSEVTATTFDNVPILGNNVPAGAFGLDTKVDVGRDALVPASYLAWRYNDQIVFALGMNSQFGLGTKPDNLNWVGQAHAQTSKLFSMNINPAVSYEIMPGVTVGAGLQIQYIDLKRFKVAAGFPAGPTSKFDASDISVGFTLGVNFKPTRTTSIGIGYRSKISHDLDGSLNNAVALPGTVPLKASLDTPEKVTASFRQEIGANMRLLGTVEWVNWSRLQVVPLNFSGPIAPAVPPTALDFGWEDGWFFSLGAEYDVNDKMTIRFGGAYEISPIDDPTARLVQLPDADRIWASVGGTYKWNEHMSFDFAYSHVFVEDETLSRVPASSPVPTLNANTESSVDILSVGMTMTLPPLD